MVVVRKFKEQRICCDCGSVFIAAGFQTKKKRCDGCSWIPCSNCGDLIRKRLDCTRYCDMRCRTEHQYNSKLCPCGVEIVKGSKGNARKKYCSEQCRIRFVDYGQYGKRCRGISKSKGYKQSPEHIRKRMLGTQSSGKSSRPSKEELSLVPTLTRLGYRHTGDGTLWRRWPDGTTHNPDFIHKSDRKIVEYFGSYWHEPDEVDYAKQQWHELGYDCLVIWDYEREAFLDDPSRFIPVGTGR